MKLTLANDKTTTATNSDKMEPFSTLTTSRAREHIPIREILNRQEIRNLMKELQPAQSQAIKPKISYDQLKTIVRTSGVELEELVSWREETWSESEWADYDMKMKESETQEGVSLRWEVGLNKQHIAYFSFGREESELRLDAAGDGLQRRRLGRRAGRLGLHALLSAVRAHPRRRRGTAPARPPRCEHGRRAMPANQRAARACD